MIDGLISPRIISNVLREFKICLFGDVKRVFFLFMLLGPHIWLTVIHALRKSVRHVTARLVGKYWGKFCLAKESEVPFL